MGEASDPADSCLFHVLAILRIWFSHARRWSVGQKKEMHERYFEACQVLFGGKHEIGWSWYLGF